MTYSIKAHPTFYKGIRFRSRLEATWAAFFDLAGWEWKYEPVDLTVRVDGKNVLWNPDFYVKFSCGHSECRGFHHLYVEVKPYYSIEEFDDHIVSKMDRFDEPSPAMFGISPSVSYWEMTHGAGGGEECVEHWAYDAEVLWAKAQNITQYQHPTEDSDNQ